MINKDCTKCEIHLNTFKMIESEGDINSDIMLVGESSNHTENLIGRPFVGMHEALQSSCGNCKHFENCHYYVLHQKPSVNGNLGCVGFSKKHEPYNIPLSFNQNVFNTGGQLLDRILNAIGIYRDELYITYAVKCHTIGSGVPTIENIENCRYLLLQEMKTVNPKVIVAMGKRATYAVLGEMTTEKKIQKGHVTILTTHNPEAVVKFYMMTQKAYAENNPKYEYYSMKVRDKIEDIRDTIGCAYDIVKEESCATD